ncbi:MAG: hypothetical protein I8H96_03560 [Sphingomonadaceae bacterium]|nr:hypothetical protein [Sphingomonadaceae bacterium]
MTPIERAARALCSLQGDPDDNWRTYVPHVEVVMNALHEPSEHMKEAGGEIFHSYNPEHSEIAHQSDAANVWRLMVTAMRNGAQN